MREVSHVYVEQVARFTDNNRLVRPTSRINSDDIQWFLQVYFSQIKLI